MTIDTVKCEETLMKSGKEFILFKKIPRLFHRKSTIQKLNEETGIWTIRDDKNVLGCTKDKDWAEYISGKFTGASFQDKKTRKHLDKRFNKLKEVI